MIIDNILYYTMPSLDKIGYFSHYLLLFLGIYWLRNPDHNLIEPIVLVVTSIVGIFSGSERLYLEQSKVVYHRDNKKYLFLVIGALLLISTCNYSERRERIKEKQRNTYIVQEDSNNSTHRKQETRTSSTNTGKKNKSRILECGEMIIYRPPFSVPKGSSGTVMIDVDINSRGAVSKTSFNTKQSTTTEQWLIEYSSKLAQQYKFTESGLENRQCYFIFNFGKKTE